MTLATIILIVSLLSICFLLVSKTRELNTGKGIIKIKEVYNQKVVDVYQKVVIFVRGAPQALLRVLILWILKHFYHLKKKTAEKVYPKIAHLVDAVKGRDLPKNKGSVSFFLEKVKEHSDSLKKKL